MAITVNVSDPIVFMLAFGQYYPATVVATDSADPPVLTVQLTQDGRQFTKIPYDANLQKARRWCRYIDNGRPDTLHDPAIPIVNHQQPINLVDADARYLTQTEADALYEPIS